MMRTRLLTAAVVAVACMSTAVFAQPGRGRGGFQMGPEQLIGIEVVQTELKITDEQKEKLKAMPKLDFQSFRGLSEEERTKKLTEYREGAKKVLDETLNDEQKTRIKQIALQARGASALNDEQIAKDLGLSDDQKKSIKEIAETRSTTQPGGQFDRAAAQKAREERNMKLLAVLNDEQKKKFEEMQGPKFDTSKLFQGFGRRPGGNNNNNEEKKTEEKK